MNFSYKDLYGISLETYSNRLHKATSNSPPSLFAIRKTEEDIAILKENYQRYAQRSESLTESEIELVWAIRVLIEKKQRHLERMKQWMEKS